MNKPARAPKAEPSAARPWKEFWQTAAKSDLRGPVMQTPVSVALVGPVLAGRSVVVNPFERSSNERNPGMMIPNRDHNLCDQF